MEREETALILDYLPYGYPLERKRVPIAQAIGVNGFALLHLVPRRGVSLQGKEIVYIGSGKRDKIYYILGRMSGDKLTETAKQNLAEFIAETIKKDEKKFVEFFNKADAINTRLHQIELLPGFGKKHMQEILKARAEKPFESFEEIKTRISSIPSPQKAVEKRIIDEITQEERHKIFVR